MRQYCGLIFLPNLRMLPAAMNRLPASKWDKRHGFRQRSADGCHGVPRQLYLPVGMEQINRQGGAYDYRPTSTAIEAATYGRQETGNGSGQGWDERARSVLKPT